MGLSFCASFAKCKASGFRDVTFSEGGDSKTAQVVCLCVHVVSSVNDHVISNGPYVYL